MIAPPDRRGSLSSLNDKRVGIGPGSLGAPLASLGTLTLEPEIAVISRKDGQRTNIIRASVEPYALPAPITAQFQAALEAADFTLPPGYNISLGGEAEARGDATGGLASTALPLIIAMAGCIALVFNSFRMALLVLVSGFLSVGFAIFGVWAFGLPFGFNAIVGGMGLLGISINGTIVVLAYLKENPAAWAGDRGAQLDTVVAATRHIVATTLTTMGGFVPILLSGDQFWLPLASGIALGVAGSAILALYFTPSVFAIGAATRRKLAHWQGKDQVYPASEGHDMKAPAE